MKYLYIKIVLLGNIAILLACKDSWLDAKPDKKLVVPSTLDDFQALLNNRDVFSRNYPFLGEASADEGYVTYDTWLSFPMTYARNTYIWEKDIFEGEPTGDWISAFNLILNANVVLDGIEKITPSNAKINQYNSIKGQALFFRGLSFYNLSQVFCNAYQMNTALSDLGLPLRLSSNVNDKVQRATLQETYDQIMHDLIEAKALLPENQSAKTQPNKASAAGILARIYLSMEKYADALAEANTCLSKDGKLLDYNTLDIALEFPFDVFNDEVLWHAEMTSGYNLPSADGIVDTTLYSLYGVDDLRRTLFFKVRDGNLKFTGNYNNSRYGLFCGIATDELYLIRAECLVRSGQIQEGMDALNTLLKTRWKTDNNGVSTYVDQMTSNETDALKIILEERRKELMLRSVRWSDLRRLNRDDRFQVTLTRNLNGRIYSLPPNDPRYTLPIPPDEIRISNLDQNPR